MQLKWTDSFDIPQHGIGLCPSTFDHDLRQTRADVYLVLCSPNSHRAPADTLDYTFTLTGFSGKGLVDAGNAAFA